MIDPDVWAKGDAYEPFIGRWSRRVALVFLDWLDVPPRARWLDVGTGTGALSRTILERADPERVDGVDPSARFLAYAVANVRDPRVAFGVADAMSLPFPDGTFDATVSGLVLNFVPDPQRGAAEMIRVTAPGGTVAVYVWDYLDGMEMIKRFWDVAVELDPAATALNEAARFPTNEPGRLTEIFLTAGLADVETRPIDVPTPFRDFDDYWTPFLGGQGPAPRYVMSLPPEPRDALRERLRATLPAGPDGAIELSARAWALRGLRPRGR